MWPNVQFPADLVTFTEEILNGELHLLWSACSWITLEFTWIETEPKITLQVT